MIVSPGPFITCFLTTIVLIAYLFFIIYFKKEILYEGMKFTFAVIILIMIRMMIPVNFPFTVTIPVTGFLTSVNRLLYYHINGKTLRPADILFTIWIVGAVVELLIMYWENRNYRRLLLPFRVKDLSKYPTIEKLMKEYHATSITLCMVPQPVSPAIYGVWKPLLVMPDIKLTGEELEFACRHELEHYKNHDLWLKLFVDLTVCVQWFNPLVKLLQDELVLAFEMSNDNKVLRDCSEQQRLNYLLELIKIARIQNGRPRKPRGLSFTQDEDRTTKRRIYFVTDYRKIKGKSSSVFLRYIIVVVVLIISFVFVPEGYEVENTQDNEAIKVLEDNSYLIKCEEGYQLYVDGVYTYTFSVIHEEFKDLPIIEEEEIK